MCLGFRNDDVGTSDWIAYQGAHHWIKLILLLAVAIDCYSSSRNEALRQFPYPHLHVIVQVLKGQSYCYNFMSVASL